MEEFYSSEENNDLNDETPVEQHNPPLEQTPSISLQAMSGLPAAHTIRVQGSIMGNPVNILVDTGSTHSFINDKLAHKIGLHITQSDDFRVLVASGEQLKVTGVCQGVLFKCQELVMSIDLLLLPLEGCQVVLGVEWLKQFDDIIFNFTEPSAQI